MHRLRCLAAQLFIVLAFLLALASSQDDDDDAAFAEYEDDKPSSGSTGGTTTTTTSSRLQRHELPEDGFVWPTTDEEHYADYMPYEHHCSACRGVAFQIDKALNELMPKDAPRRPLVEHEFEEAMECRTKIYDDYGLKKLQDKSRVLVGPGMPHEKDGGSVFGGAKWPSRMARYCGGLVGDLGEAEVYRLWTQNEQSFEGFFKALCDPTCTGKKREKKAEPEEVEEPVKKQRRKKKEPKEEPKLEGPPKVVKVFQKKDVKKLAKKSKFVFVLFCAKSFARCQKLEKEWELAARAALKTDDLKEMKFALADTDTAGTFDYQFDRDILPAFLLFRQGYKVPKGVTPEEMLTLREAGDFLNYLQGELETYMQDDEESFPRGKLEL